MEGEEKEGRRAAEGGREGNGEEEGEGEEVTTSCTAYGDCPLH